MYINNFSQKLIIEFCVDQGPRLELNCDVDQSKIDEIQQFYVKHNGRLHRKYGNMFNNRTLFHGCK